jgi:hypothetical protein
VAQEAAHEDQVGRRRGRHDGRDGRQVDAVGRHGDRGVRAEMRPQALAGLGRRGEDVVGQPHRGPLDRPAHRAGATEVGRPVLRAPHLVPGDDESLASHGRDEPQGEEAEVGHVVGFDDVEAPAQQPQAPEGEDDRLEDRAAALGVEGEARRQRVERHVAVAERRIAAPPVHGVHVDVAMAHQAARELVVTQLLAALVVGIDRVGDERDDPPACAAHDAAFPQRVQ